MKNTYRVMLIGLAVLGVVYASTGPEKMTKDVKYEAIEKCLKSSTGPEKKTKEVKYEAIDICTLPVSMEVAHYVQIKNCGDLEMKLEQVDCEDIGKGGRDFPCYGERGEGNNPDGPACVIIEVRANFPAILSASLNKSGGDEDMLKDFNLYWENGVNTIQGTGDWEEFKLYLEAWDVEIWKFTVGAVKVGEITIGVSPPDETQLED